ncbi:helix-turn-helix domain-containing protein [Shivajiella indica]|uniref:Helix-turn-helix domain-containing protein n=1 Tax=Shivajiella indica TaxID=872115 RepID=A0ABW5B9M1_9BACT
MEITLDWKNLIYLSSQLIGYLIGFVLIIYGYRKNRSNILLGFIFLVFSYMSFISWLIFTGNFIHFPALYRSGNLLALFTVPIIYLYIRTVIKSDFLQLWDVLHFIPAFIFLVDYWPVFLLENPEKLKLIKSEIAYPELFTQYTQSRFFSFDFYTILRTSMLAVYWIFSVKLVWDYSVRLKDEMDDFGKQWLIWIKIFLGFELLLFLPYFLLNWFYDPLISFELLHGTLALLTVVSAVALIFFPNILYGINKKEKKQASIVKSKSESKEMLSPTRIQEIEVKLDQVLTKEKKFLQRGYSIHSLAMDTDVPVYLLTQFINQHLNTNFFDLINEKRVEESCKLIESGRFDHLSIVGMAELSGFNNRNSFTLAFQKFKNVSPSVYIRSVRKKGMK